jgi:hypothetical protein
MVRCGQGRRRTARAEEVADITGREGGGRRGPGRRRTMMCGTGGTTEEGVTAALAHLRTLGEARRVMALSKGANSSGLQMQSFVARVNFPHKGTRGLISNSRGIVEAPLVLL